MGILVGISICAILYIIVIIIYARSYGYNYHFNELEGKTIVITGSSAGIGKAVLNELIKTKAKIIVCGKQPNEDERVSFVQLDLSDIESIKQCSQQIHKMTDKIDILINNAGCLYTVFDKKTVQGYDLTLGTNYIGNAAFTIQLLDLLNKGDYNNKSRILITSSLNAGDWHNKDIPFVFDDNKKRKPVDPYYASKFGNSLFATCLAQKYDKIDVVHIHPGLVKSSLWRNFPFILDVIYKYLLLPAVGRTCEEGSQTILYCCFAPYLQSGQYYADCIPQQINPLLRDQQVLDENWEKLMKELNTYYIQP